MASPFFLFENVLESGTLTASTEVDGWPAENLLDWRPGTAYRWRAAIASTPATVEVDLGVGNEILADAIGIAGHNLDEDAGGIVGLDCDYSDDGAAWTTAATLSSFVDFQAKLPHCQRLDSPPGAAKRYWRIRVYMISGAFTFDPQIGVCTIGRLLEFPGQTGGVEFFSRSVDADFIDNQDGVFIGSNVKHPTNLWNIDYSEGGLDRDTFFRPASGINFDTDFRAHIYADKPFWYVALDSGEVETTEGLLVRTRDWRMPFLGIKQRRGLQATLRAWNDRA